MKNLISIIFIVVVFAATNVSAEKNITLECECINLNVADSPFEFSLFINESLEKVTMEYLRGRGGQRKVQNPPARFSAEEIVIRWGRDRTIIFNRTTFELSGVGAGGEVKGSCEIKNTES